MLVIDVTLNYLKFMVTFYMTQPMKGKLDFRWLNSLLLPKNGKRFRIKRDEVCASNSKKKQLTNSEFVNSMILHKKWGG